MNEEELDQRLAAVKEKRLPECPSNLEANVLRRVRLAESQLESDFLSWIGALIPRTSFVMGALALVVATSSVVTYASTSSRMAEVERRTEVSQALDLGFVKSVELFDFSKH